MTGNLMRCYMDESVDPCDRFYDYACGKWGNFHPIPKDKGGYDIFEILREDMDAKLIQVHMIKMVKILCNFTAPKKVRFMFLGKSKYRQPLLYAVFLSAISRICDPEMTFFWNLSSNYQSSLFFLYAKSLYASLFLESLSLSCNEVQL